MSYAIGRTGFSLNAVMSRPKWRVGVEVYMSGTKAKGFFHQLREQKDHVERQLGYGLEWEELPAGTDSRISNYPTRCRSGGPDRLAEAAWVAGNETK